MRVGIKYCVDQCGARHKKGEINTYLNTQISHQSTINKIYKEMKLHIPKKNIMKLQCKIRWQCYLYFYGHIIFYIHIKDPIYCIKIGSSSRFSVPRCFSSISPKHSDASAKSSRSCQWQGFYSLLQCDWSALLVAPALL
jgi:hypothetical protein